MTKFYADDENIVFLLSGDEWAIPMRKIDKMQRAAEYADLVLKIFSILALIGGGIWAYFQFQIGGAHDWVTNLAVQTEVLPYRDDLRLVVVHVKSKNPRPTRNELRKPADSFKVVVRQVSADLKSKSVVTERDGAELVSADLLPNDGLDLLPYAEFDDVVSFVLPAGITVMVSAEMDVANGTRTKDGKTDHDFVSTSAVIPVGTKMELEQAERKRAGMNP